MDLRQGLCYPLLFLSRGQRARGPGLGRSPRSLTLLLTQVDSLSPLFPPSRVLPVCEARPAGLSPRRESCRHQGARRHCQELPGQAGPAAKLHQPVTSTFQEFAPTCPDGNFSGRGLDNRLHLGTLSFKAKSR